MLAWAVLKQKTSKETKELQTCVDKEMKRCLCWYKKFLKPLHNFFVIPVSHELFEDPSYVQGWKLEWKTLESKPHEVRGG